MLLTISLSLSAAAQGRGKSADTAGSFHVSSTTFVDRATLPLSMINNVIVNGSNSCSIEGSPGGNESPELSWTTALAGTASFVVTTYDNTAAFTHWGMYNISPTATGLPENAGVAGSTYGEQIFNDCACLLCAAFASAERSVATPGPTLAVRRK
jgi:phosphatidylethanolamine-binding protein (PEBP) family uncharacterized protein